MNRGGCGHLNDDVRSRWCQKKSWDHVPRPHGPRHHFGRHNAIKTNLYYFRRRKNCDHSRGLQAHRAWIGNSHICCRKRSNPCVFLLPRARSSFWWAWRIWRASSWLHPLAFDFKLWIVIQLSRIDMRLRIANLSNRQNFNESSKLLTMTDKFKMNVEAFKIWNYGAELWQQLCCSTTNYKCNNKFNQTKKIILIIGIR